MKKNLYKILSCTLVFLLLLTACGKNDSDDKSATPDKDSNEQQEDVGQGEDVNSDNYEPKTLKIMGSVDSEIWETRENQPIWEEFQKWLDEVNLTLEIEAIVDEQYEQILKTRTATAMDLPDVINLNTMDIPTAISLGESGIFQDVKPLVEQYSNGNVQKLQETYFPDFWSSSTTETGETYWFPNWYKATYEETKPFSSIQTPLIRADWLEKIGMEKPTTADEFVEALVAMREKDVNESGKEDEVLLYSPGFNFFGPSFGLPNDHISVDIYEHKAKSPWLMKDELIPYIEFLQTLVNKGILDTDSLDKPYEYVLQKVKSNKVACRTGYANTDFYSADVAEFDGSYEGVIFKGGVGEQYVQSELPEFVQGKMAITNKCDDPEAAVRYFDLISTPEFAKLHRYGLEGDGHTMDGDVLVPNNKINDRDHNIDGHANGNFLWPNIIGSLALEQAETLRLSFLDNPVVLDFHDNHSLDNHKYYYSGYQLAIQSQDELDKEAELWADLSTYMDETITKLALGQYKIEDLDKYIDKMKELGLEDMVEVYQARHDRYIQQ